MPETAAAREAKYTVLFHSVNKLKAEILKGEDLIDQLYGRNKSIQIEAKTPAPKPSLTFQEIYDGLPGALAEICDRIIKIRQELENLLI